MTQVRHNAEECPDFGGQGEQAMLIEPYLFFAGRCEEAMDFYKGALGAEIAFMMRFKESPEPENNPPGMDEKIMHANLKIGEQCIMMSDGCGDGAAKFEGISLSICPDSEDEAQRIFDALSEGGEITMPLGKTFWAQCFGMVKDKFGVQWMVNFEG